MIGPVLFPVCVAGVIALLRRPDWRPVRWLAPATAIMVALTLVAGSQVHYPYGLVSVIFAVGCVPAAEFARRGPAQLRLVAAATVVHVVLGVVVSLPVLPERVLAATFVPTLSTGLAEQIGWEDYVRQIDAVTAAAQATDPGVVVLTSNYGEAGALARYTDHPDVLVVSGHNALGYLGVRRPAPGRWSSWGPGCLRWRVSSPPAPRPAGSTAAYPSTTRRKASRSRCAPARSRTGRGCSRRSGTSADAGDRATTTRAGRSTPTRSISYADTEFDFGRARKAVRPFRICSCSLGTDARAGDHVPNDRAGLLAVGRGDVEMGDRPDHPWPEGGHGHALLRGLPGHGGGRHSPGVDDDDVGGHGIRVDGGRGSLRDRRGERVRGRVVVGKPGQVVVQPVRRPGGQDPGLSHPPTEALPPDPGLSDPVLAVLTSIEPTGAPRPLEKQTLTVSNSRP